MRQLIRIFNVFVLLSEPRMIDSCKRNYMTDSCIDSEVILMMLMCKDPFNYMNDKIIKI